MSYIPPGPYRWTMAGLVDSENDVILKPSYPAALNQDKATNLEGFIEHLPQYVEDMEDSRKDAQLFLAMITSVLARGCQTYVQGSSFSCRTTGRELCPVCELQAHFDCYQKEQGLCTPELTGSKIA